MLVQKFAEAQPLMVIIWPSKVTERRTINAVCKREIWNRKTRIIFFLAVLKSVFFFGKTFIYYVMLPCVDLLLTFVSKSQWSKRMIIFIHSNYVPTPIFYSIKKWVNNLSLIVFLQNCWGWGRIKLSGPNSWSPVLILTLFIHWIFSHIPTWGWDAVVLITLAVQNLITRLLAAGVAFSAIRTGPGRLWNTYKINFLSKWRLRRL